MPILLKTRVKHSQNANQSLSRPCRRFVRLSQLSRARTHREHENRTLRRRAGVLQEWQAQKKDVCERISAEGEAASGEAGESQGVVRAPLAVTSARRAGSFGDLRGGC